MNGGAATPYAGAMTRVNSIASRISSARSSGQIAAKARRVSEMHRAIIVSTPILVGWYRRNFRHRRRFGLTFEAQTHKTRLKHGRVECTALDFSVTDRRGWGC